MKSANNAYVAHYKQCRNFRQRVVWVGSGKTASPQGAPPSPTKPFSTGGIFPRNVGLAHNVGLIGFGRLDNRQPDRGG